MATKKENHSRITYDEVCQMINMGKQGINTKIIEKKVGRTSSTVNNIHDLYYQTVTLKDDPNQLIQWLSDHERQYSIDSLQYVYSYDGRTMPPEVLEYYENRQKIKLTRMRQAGMKEKRMNKLVDLDNEAYASVEEQTTLDLSNTQSDQQVGEVENPSSVLELLSSMYRLQLSMFREIERMRELWEK